jgi:hypothetical protein
MEPVTGWQAFVNHLANAERIDRRRRKQEAIGRVLYAVVFAAIVTIIVGLAMQALRWI